MDNKKVGSFVNSMLKSWLPHKIRVEKIPNFSIKISLGGRTILTDSYGERKENVVLTGSITKTFTALSVLKLVEEKKINLDDRASDHLNWLVKKGKNARNMTIRDLLTHRSGIARDVHAPYFSDLKFPKAGELMERALPEFGKNINGFKYSNLGYVVLGEIIEAVSGKRYIDFLQKKVFYPMKAGSLRPVSESDLSGYSLIDGNISKEDGPADVCAMLPSFGLAMSMDDFHLFFQRLSRGDLGRKIFKDFYPAEFGEDYGSGLYRTPSDGSLIYSNSGSLFGRQAFACFDRKNDIVVTMDADLRQAPLYHMALGIMDIFHRVIRYPEYHLSRKHKNTGRHNGLYRSMFGHLILYGYGDRIFAFDPSVNNPLSNSMHIGYSKGEYKITSSSRQAEIGEKIDFYERDEKDHLRIGAVEYERL